MNRISTSSVNSSFKYTAPTKEAQNRFASAPDNSPLVATTTSITQTLVQPGRLDKNHRLMDSKIINFSVAFNLGRTRSIAGGSA
ncbi:type III effector [Pseudomonas syringae group genomosp. 3]|uniref:type III effector n=1 Tax=Pseudomonas syringae group genomosp. 3 TaxID=251701 RepID=UPI0006E53D7F|nr:type III effector [Pseudomonas syringae group genomosp. 3]KPW44527.1 hypothetical protein ALO86_200307 [Pseudomonas syringae pv. berberidis]RMP65055.1 Type III effector HopAQ1 [Pseudomonas syringae pv. berberidis]RMQ39668.1 Type III effector HopAQ1 [Pseudomonas syringae pv. berberidis]